MLRYPQLAINGMEMVAQHFVQVSARYRELATERVERRISHAILRLVRQVGEKSDEGILIDIPLSRQDLAEMTGTTLYTTSRVLSQWEKNGWIKTGREQVTLLQPHEACRHRRGFTTQQPCRKNDNDSLAASSPHNCSLINFAREQRSFPVSQLH